MNPGARPAKLTVAGSPPMLAVTAVAASAGGLLGPGEFVLTPGVVAPKPVQKIETKSPTCTGALAMPGVTGIAKVFVLANKIAPWFPKVPPSVKIAGCTAFTPTLVAVPDTPFTVTTTLAGIPGFKSDGA